MYFCKIKFLQSKTINVDISSGAFVFYAYLNNVQCTYLNNVQCTYLNNVQCTYLNNVQCTYMMYI